MAEVNVWKKFFWTLFGAMFFLCAATIFFNMFIDAYGIYSLPHKVGLNYFPCKSKNTERLCKPLHFAEKNPSIIFLGNSKADFALDGEFFAELSGREKNSVYNLAVQNCQIYESRKFLEYALKLNPDLQKVVLALDFEMFMEGIQSIPGFEPARLETRHITRKDFFETTLSFDALKANIFSLQQNFIHDYDYKFFSPDGKFTEKNLENIFRFEDSFAKNSRNVMMMSRYNAVLPKEKFSELREIKKICAEKNIELQAVILPVHVSHLRSYFLDRETFENWLRQTVEIIPVTSFLDCPEISDVNPDLPLDENIYFWDSAHVKKIVGDKILSQLSGREKNFGVTITPENVNEHLQKIWSNLQSFAEKNPAAMKKLNYVGTLSEEPPYTGNFAETNFPVEIKNAGVGIFPDGKILRAEGIIELDAEEIQSAYLLVTDSGGKKFYTMTNRMTIQPEVMAAETFFDADKQTYYNFLGETFFDLPPGEYDLKILFLTKPGELFTTPNLKKVFCQ